MKNTVITKKIDGFDIVVGFGELSIEPVETGKIVSAKIVTTDEFKVCADKKDKISAALRSAHESLQKVKTAKGDVDKEKQYKDHLICLEQAQGYEKELYPLAVKLKNKIVELKKTHAVYFEPKAGEVAKSEADILTLRGLIGGIKGVALVDIDGNVVPDNRGIIYCQNKSGKWSTTQIVALGNSVPKGATVYSDLDAEQKKEVDLQMLIDAAGKMTVAERLAMKSAEEEKALASAANLRSQLEIQGDANALAKSQDFYNARLQELGVIYG